MKAMRMVAAVCAMMVCSALASAEEAGIWVQGTVTVQKDKDTVKAITIKALDWDENDKEVTVLYHVVLDKTGLTLVAKADGEVEAFGVVVNKGTPEKPDFWITVSKLQAPPAPDSAPAVELPKGDTPKAEAPKTAPSKSDAAQ